MSTSPSSTAVVWVADGEAWAGQDYGSRLMAWMSSLGYSVTRRDLTQFGAPDTSARHHLITGGETSVNDTSSWMPAGMETVRALLKSAAEGQCSVFGVCLGAQMIAHALWPGCVRRGPSIEVGLTEITVANWPEPAVVSAFHYEEIDPRAVTAGGGTIIASNGHSAVQGFAYGDAVRGVQFHPELSPDDIRRLIAEHTSTIRAMGGDVATALASVDAYADRWSGLALGGLIADT